MIYVVGPVFVRTKGTQVSVLNLIKGCHACKEDEDALQKMPSGAETLQERKLAISSRYIQDNSMFSD